MTVRIVHKNSEAEDKRPSAGQLAKGEIAVNLNAAGAFLTVKDTDGNIQQVGGVKVDTSSPGTPVLGTLWVDPAQSRLYVYDGTNWLLVTGTGGGGGGGGGGVVDQVIAGDGLTGGGSSSVVTLNVAGGNGIVVAADNVAVDLVGDANRAGLEFDGGRLQTKIASATTLGSVKEGTNITIDADGTINAAGGGGGGGVVDSVTAGDGLTGGGSAADVTINAGAGDGIAVSADEIAVDLDDTAATVGLEFSSGKLQVKPATAGALGSVKEGSNITIDADGTINSTATGGGTIDTVVAGVGLTGGGSNSLITLDVGAGSGIAVGISDVSIDLTADSDRVGLEISSDKLQAKIATASSLGVVKQGTNITIAADGTISAAGGGGGGTTYGISAVDDGGSQLRLTSSDGVEDDVELAAGAGIQIDVTDEHTFTITNTSPGSGAPGDGDIIINGTAGEITASGENATADQNTATTRVLGLADTAVTPGSYTYTSLTVDAKGRITDASNGTPPVTPFDGNLVIKLFGQAGATQTGSFTANEEVEGTITLPQIDYNQLANLPTPETIGNGGLTIKFAGQSADDQTGTFTANQPGDSTITLPAIDYDQLTNKPTIPAPANNGALTIKFTGQPTDDQTGTFTADQSGDTTITLPAIDYNQLINKPSGGTPGDGALTIESFGEGAASTGSFTANQSGDSSLTLPQIRWDDLANKPTIATDALWELVDGGNSHDQIQQQANSDMFYAKQCVYGPVQYTPMFGTTSVPAFYSGNIHEVDASATVINDPLDALPGMMGIFILASSPGWGNKYKWSDGAPTITSFPAIVPYAVRVDGNIYMGKVVEGIA